MGKILLVEPHKILQQAITLALFPDHEVQVEESFTASTLGSLKEYDLLIVDASGLRENNQFTAEMARVIQGCKTPTVWLEDSESSHSPKRDKLAVVKKPIERELFQSAVDDFLSPGTVKGRGSSTVPSAAKGSQAKESAKKTGAEPSQMNLIDLVDVVEEGPPPKQAKKSSKKST